MRKILIIELLLIFLCSNALAQNNSSFKEQDLTVIIKDGAQNQVAKAQDAINVVKTSAESIANHKKFSSLMFDDEQTSEIDKAVEYLKLDPETRARQLNSEAKLERRTRLEEENEKSYIYLGSIIYLNANHWVIWLNNQKITSLTNKKNEELYVKSIQKEKVKIMWQITFSKWKILSNYNNEDVQPEVNADNKVEIEFELKPNQTFILSTKRVVEGKIAPLIITTPVDEVSDSEQSETLPISNEINQNEPQKQSGI